MTPAESAVGVELKWVAVPEAQDMWEGDLIDAEVEGEQILIVHHLDGSFHAFQGLCPHQEVLLADGTWDEDSCVLACPGHLWEFNLKTGRGVNPSGSVLFRYPIREQGGAVSVGIPQDGETHYNKSLEDGAS